MDGILGYNFVAVASRIYRNKNLVDKGMVQLVAGGKNAAKV